MDHIKDLRRINTLVFDIETANEYFSFEEMKEANPTLAEEFTKKFRKEIDEETIGKFESDYKADIYYKKIGALNPEYGRVLCCSFTTLAYKEGEWVMNTKSFESTNERELLEKVNTVFTKGGWTIAGMNIGNFDIPFLLKRMMVHGIKPTSHLLNNVFAKPWERDTVDLADIWAFGGYRKASMASICGALGIETPKGGVWGPLVPSFYWTGECSEIYDKQTFTQDEALNIITEYCEKDTIATAQCLAKLNDTIFGS